ncbi:diiron oxygenase [Streptomyces sp. NPDC004787]|uniref:AurF N-oxygenase family protein n=1 Tax=Streptomyces sp. NPDC004787 TaxID=3154291 RepID=UPI0033A9B659
MSTDRSTDPSAEPGTTTTPTTAPATTPATTAASDTAPAAGVVPPELPAHDPADVTENAVIARLAGNWHRRAAVKREEPDLDTLYDVTRDDYPERILPFRDHPTFTALAPEDRTRLLSWAWVSYNRTTVLLEGQIVNPAFQLGLDGGFPQLGGELMQRSLAQAMVDEQYHTLMHLNASAVTRRKRGWALPDAVLPKPLIVRRHDELRAAASEEWERSLTTLAFATVAEISINAYLNLIADDKEIQPVNSAAVRIHNRDEYCHASIAAVLAEKVHADLDGHRQRFFLKALVDGLEAFVGNDFTTWHRIMDETGIPGGHAMLDDIQAAGGRKRLIQDFTGLHQLVERLGALDRVDFDWSRSITDSDAASPAA